MPDVCEVDIGNAVDHLEYVGVVLVQVLVNPYAGLREAEHDAWVQEGLASVRHTLGQTSVILETKLTLLFTQGIGGFEISQNESYLHEL